MGKVVRRNLAVIVVAVFAPSVYAEGEPVSGDVKLGYVASSGNSESESLSFASKLELRAEEFLHKFSLETFSGSQNGSTSAERYAFAYQLNTNITDTQSAFIRADYDDDRFSGFDYQVAVTAGISSKWSLPVRHTLITDAGLGMRSSKLSVGGTEDEAIARLAATYTLIVTETANFEQSFSADIGEESTVSKAVSTFAIAISEVLSLNVSLHFKHFSKPAAGAGSLDRETTVSLGYSF